MSDLGLAISMTARAFVGVTDKGGVPYIMHCLHVMNKVSHLNDDELMIIAVLHDLIEDTNYTFEILESLGFSKRVIDVLRLLTHDPEVPYMDYISALSLNPDARIVKMADLDHNSRVTRMKGIRPKDLRRIEKYQKAFSFLQNDAVVPPPVQHTKKCINTPATCTCICRGNGGVLFG